MIAEQRIKDLEDVSKTLHNGNREKLVVINDVVHDTGVTVAEICRGFNGLKVQTQEMNDNVTGLKDSVEVLQNSVSVLVDRKPTVGWPCFWSVLTGTSGIVAIFAMVFFH